MKYIVFRSNLPSSISHVCHHFNRLVDDQVIGPIFKCRPKTLKCVVGERKRQDAETKL